MTITLIATTVMGLESVLAREIRELGFEDVRVMDTKVEFSGTLKDICRANLLLRTAGRIYIKIAEFKAVTFDDLYEKTKHLDWAQWITQKDAFPVSKVMSRKSVLFSRSDCQAIVKKAVVDSLKKAHKVQYLPEMDAQFPIRVQIEKDIVTLSIDASGSGLNKRGYRAHHDKAPLRETLAAGMVLLSRWRADDVLIDPFCGSGTILIEAAWIAKNIAPGFYRRFNSDKWNVISKTLWKESRREAEALFKPDQKVRIYGSDSNYKAISIANKNIQLAGLSDIYVQKLDARDVSSKYERGKIITNPPYGERLNEKEDAEKLYQDIGQVFTERFPDWHYYILTSDKYFENHFDAPAAKRRKLFNGGIECQFYQYF